MKSLRPIEALAKGLASTGITMNLNVEGVVGVDFSFTMFIIGTGGVRQTPSDIAVERQTQLCSSGARAGHAHTQNGVGPQTLLVVGAVAGDRNGQWRSDRSLSSPTTARVSLAFRVLDGL